MDVNQTAETAAPQLPQHAVRHGVILGGINIVLTMVAYVTSLSFMGSFKFISLVLIADVGYVIYAGVNFRNADGGYLSYGKAYYHGFLTLAVCGLMGTVFGILLYHVIDADLAQKMTDVIVQNTEETMTSFGAPQSRIDQTISEMKGDLAKGFTIGGQLYGYVKILMVNAVIVLLTSLIVRKNVPLEM